MLSKSATMLLGLIYETPLNAYEITKRLQIMNVRRWYNIADSTVYATLKTLEKKNYIVGTSEKEGNMPDKTVYSLTETGSKELIDTLRKSILSFDYDTNVFSIAAFFINIFNANESIELLTERLVVLNKYLAGIDNQLLGISEPDVSTVAIANVERTKDIVLAEISGTKKILDAIARA